MMGGEWNKDPKVHVFYCNTTKRSMVASFSRHQKRVDESEVRGGGKIVFPWEEKAGSADKST